MAFQFLTSFQIDRQKWDNTLSKDPLSPAYAYSWYLDTVADNWGAIISSDYSCIMPFAFRKKFQLKYFYQPFFTRNFGVYGRTERRSEIFSFLSTLSKEYRYWDFCIDTIEIPVIGNASIANRTYQVLDLNKPFEALLQEYTGKLRRSIRDASNEQLDIRSSNDIADFTKKFKQFTSNKVKEFSNVDYQRLEKLLDVCKKNAFTWHLSAKKGNEELASAFFVKTGNRIIYIEGYNSPSGREYQAMHLLFDHFIRENAAQKLVLDFGGSNIPSIAHFFKAFGAVDVNYFNVRMNNLPLFFKHLKK